MIFNKGFLCPNCGPIREAKDKSILKVKHKACKECEAVVNVWERPMNERAGRCGNCANGAFVLAMGKGQLKGQLLRKCKVCGEVINPDQPESILVKGAKENEYKKPVRNTRAIERADQIQRAG